jgi:PhnB protein
MASRTNATGEESQVRALIEAWTTAIRAKDADGALSHYADDVVAFDLAPPLQYAGMAAMRENLTDWFPSFRGPVGYEVHDLTITASAEVAFCRSLNRIRGTRTSGEQTDVWVRATIGCRKIAGKWKIVHEHTSVPFYMDGSDKAAIDLRP